MFVVVIFKKIFFENQQGEKKSISGKYIFYLWFPKKLYFDDEYPEDFNILYSYIICWECTQKNGFLFSNWAQYDYINNYLDVFEPTDIPVGF